MAKSKKDAQTATIGNTVLADRFKNLNAKLEEAIEGTYEYGMRATNCTVAVGYVKTPDGRKAQVSICVEADKDEWIG
jgi:hypothetical protein